MNLNEYKAALPLLFSARVTPLVWGYHGIGKSSAPLQLAEEGGHKLVNFRLGNVEAGELLGLPSEVVDQYSGQKVSTRNLQPEWLTNLIKFCESNPDKYGILHLDEINHIRKDMQSFVFQMALDHKLHETEFPPNLHVICSANPPTDDYSGVFDFSNKALLSRFCHIKLQPSADEWLQFARANEFDEEIINYITTNPDQLDPVLAPFSVDEYANRNRRSFEFMSRFKKLGASSELLMGLVGSANVLAFYRWREENYEKAITGADVMDRYSEVQATVKAYRDQGKIASLSTITASVAAAVQALPEQGLVGKWGQVKNLAAYICDLPPDLGWNAALQIVLAPAGQFGPETAGAPIKEPGSVWGPHTCNALYETLKTWKAEGYGKPAAAEAASLSAPKAAKK